MQNISLLKVLLLLNLTVLSVTTGKSQDTIKCYGITGLQKIAVRIVRARECDTLLSKTEHQNQDLLLKMGNKDKEIINLNKENNLRDTIITGIHKDLDLQKAENKKLTTKLNLVKLCWVTTGVLVLLENIWIVVHSGF